MCLLKPEAWSFSEMPSLIWCLAVGLGVRCETGKPASQGRGRVAWCPGGDWEVGTRTCGGSRPPGCCILEKFLHVLVCFCFLFLVHSADKHPHSEVTNVNENTGKPGLWNVFSFYYYYWCFIKIWAQIWHCCSEWESRAGAEQDSAVCHQPSLCWLWMPACHFVKSAFGWSGCIGKLSEESHGNFSKTL